MLLVLKCIHEIQKRGDTMKRDMNKVIAQTDGTIPYGYQLTGDEWLQLAHHAAGGG